MIVEVKLPRPSRITNVLLGIVCTLLVLSIIGQFVKFTTGHDELFGLIPMLYVDFEANLPTWYSSMALLLASLILTMIGLLKRSQHDRFTRHWLGLAGIFLLLSIDEVASIHECAIEPLRTAMGATGMLYFTWVIPGSAFVLVLGLMLLRFLIHLPTRTRALYFCAGVVFVGGAIGVEMISAVQSYAHGEENLAYSLIITLEEAMEMLGVVIFIHASLEYLVRLVRSVQVELSERAVPISTDESAHLQDLGAIAAELQECLASDRIPLQD
jgi:hypothetical protein